MLQGSSWVAGESFISSIDAAKPMWLWRSIGGAMMVVSHILFAINLWNMRPKGRIANANLSKVEV
jgi:cytochrome c oxidase cbb3-type subunit 1